MEAQTQIQKLQLVVHEIFAGIHAVKDDEC
jgi:hypothetical protein